MYDPNASYDIDTVSTWEYRRNLIKERIELVNPDVVALQEVSPISFEEDFSFMSELGYDGVEIFKRGRFRPATFWKTRKCQIVTPPVHKDRTLLTAFHLNLPEDHKLKSRTWHVLNCHLQAGPNGARRLRQINEGVKASINLGKKMKGETSLFTTMVCATFDVNFAETYLPFNKN
jgi:mRNA deadenylase 3'-5' endonuclease subunit Ccr4